MKYIRFNYETLTIPLTPPPPPSKWWVAKYPSNCRVKECVYNIFGRLKIRSGQNDVTKSAVRQSHLPVAKLVVKRRSHMHDVQAAQAGALQEDQCVVVRPTIVRISQELAS